MTPWQEEECGLDPPLDEMGEVPQVLASLHEANSVAQASKILTLGLDELKKVC